MDAKIKSKNVYLFIKGEYVTAGPSEEEKDDDLFKSSSAHQEVSESISTIDVFFGSRCSYALSQYVKRVLESYKGRYPLAEIAIDKQKGESLSSS